MAKSKISCATQGCNGTILILERNRSMADRRAEYLESTGAVCEKCRKEEYRSEGLRLAQKATEMGWAELTGSEAQIVYASHQRAKNMQLIEETPARLQRQIEHLKKLGSPAKSLTNRHLVISQDALRLEAAIQNGIVDRVVQDLKNLDSASWWIEAGSMEIIIERRIEQLMARELVKPGESAEDAEARKELLAESTLAPENPITKTLAIISMVDDVVKIVFPERMDQFTQAMRGTPFHWNGSAWTTRFNPETMASPADVAAEAAVRLLANGIPVRMINQDARQKTISGQYEPYHRHWISSVNLGRDHVFINHFYDDGLYRKIRSIPGSKWDAFQKMCLVPISQFDEIRGFAAAHGYRITQSVEALLSAEQSAHEQAILVGTKPKQTTKASANRPKLDAVDTGPASSLMDD